jgi:hypothetical protein
LYLGACLNLTYYYSMAPSWRPGDGTGNNNQQFANIGAIHNTYFRAEAGLHPFLIAVAAGRSIFAFCAIFKGDFFVCDRKLLFLLIINH